MKIKAIENTSIENIVDGWRLKDSDSLYLLVKCPDGVIRPHIINIKYQTVASKK